MISPHSELVQGISLHSDLEELVKDDWHKVTPLHQTNDLQSNLHSLVSEHSQLEEGEEAQSPFVCQLVVPTVSSSSPCYSSSTSLYSCQDSGPMGLEHPAQLLVEML